MTYLLWIMLPLLPFIMVLPYGPLPGFGSTDIAMPTTYKAGA